MASIDVYTRSIEMKDLYKDNYNPERFLSYCKKCRNFNRLHSCPPFDEDIGSYLDDYPYITLIAVQLFYTEDEIEKYSGEDACMEYTKETLTPVSNQLREILLKLENIYPNTLSLSSGGCNICPDCNRIEGKPCRYPDKMRISPEALGFDMMGILKEYFNIDLQWSKGSLPKYYTLIVGLCSMETLEIASDEIAQLFHN